MNRLSGALALIALAAGSVALAQTPPSSSYPSSTAPRTSTSQQTPGSDEKAAKKAQLKDCMTQQEANKTSGMSKQQMKKYCENQVNNKSPKG